MEEMIQRAILVGVDLSNDKNFDYSVEELKNLKILTTRILYKI